MTMGFVLDDNVTLLLSWPFVQTALELLKRKQPVLSHTKAMEIHAVQLSSEIHCHSHIQSCWKISRTPSVIKCVFVSVHGSHFLLMNVKQKLRAFAQNADFFLFLFFLFEFWVKPVVFYHLFDCHFSPSFHFTCQLRPLWDHSEWPFCLYNLFNNVKFFNQLLKEKYIRISFRICHWN